MKHFFISLLLLTPLCIQAQTWETIDQQKASQVNSNKKDAANAKQKRSTDPKYLAGAVSEVDGRVQWDLTVDAPGKSTQEIYDKLLQFFLDYTKKEDQLEESHVALVNKAEHSIIVTVKEWLVFKQNFIGIDRAKTSYTIQTKCSDGKAEVILTRIIFDYTENVQGQEGIMRAEDWITDAAALNKKKTKILPGCTRFRTKMIDRKDEMFESIKNVLK